MSPRRIRLRLLDLVVTLVCAAVVAVPFVASSLADNSRPTQLESGGDVDQRVAESGVIPNPITPTFSANANGLSGSIQWDVYTTSTAGMKLAISSDRTPALRDAQSGTDIPDYTSDPKSW